MKRSWFSISTVIGLIALLAILGVLQYQWVASASSAEADKIQKRVNSDAEHFAADFNREIQNVYFNFQLDPEQWKGRHWDEFNERYDFWKSKTAYADLVKGVIFVENSPVAVPLVYSPERRTFEPGNVPADFALLREKFTDEKTFKPAYEDVPALVLPVLDHEEHLNRILVRTRQAPPEMKMEMPKKYGFLVVFLDDSVIKERILPELTAKYFPEGEFKVGVTGNDGGAVYKSAGDVTASDAQARLLELSPDRFVFFGNRDLLPRDGDTNKEVFVSQQVQTQTLSKTPGNADTKVRIEVNGERPRTTVFERNAGENAGWTMQVQHRDGSIAGFTAGQQRRSLTVGFGLLLLLAAGISLVYYSAMRARRFAQRQIDFVSSVSHEFRTPLAVIYSASENLVDGVAKDHEQVAQYGTLIKGEGKKLSGMVEQILEFAGADAGKQKYTFAKTDIKEVVDDALAECTSLFESAEIAVENNVQEGIPTISGDRLALSRAVRNLIANSVKYSNGSRWIGVSAENRSGTIKIRVKDNGIGIRSKDLGHVFEPFYRAKEVVDAQIHGNGLGLSLVKQIAEAHRGKVSVSSEPGKGSEFVIELPQS